MSDQKSIPLNVEMPKPWIKGVADLFISLAGQEKVEFQKSLNFFSKQGGSDIKIDPGFLHMIIDVIIPVDISYWDLSGQVEIT